MITLRLAAVATLVATFGLISGSPAAAQYAPCTVDIDVDSISDDDGGTVSGDVEVNVAGSNVNVFNDVNGQSEGGITPVAFTFTDLGDDEVTITATAVTPDQVTCVSSVTVEFEDDDDDSDDDSDDGGNGGGDGKKDGSLPDTGAPNSLVFGSGIALILAGAVAIFFTRRRNQGTA